MDFVPTEANAWNCGIKKNPSVCILELMQLKHEIGHLYKIILESYIVYWHKQIPIYDLLQFGIL
jgi:hypothetical protein